MLDMKVVGRRLKGLREARKEKEAGWSQSQMAKKLDKYVVNALDNENGKTTVSQLERGARNITLEMALAYAEIFGVSLDYVCGRSDDWQPVNKEIKETTGLSDKAIANIIKEKKRGHSAYVNELISHDDFNNLIHNFWKQVEYSVRRDNELSGSTDEERKKSDMERTNKAERILMEHGLPGHASTIHDWTDLMRYHLSKTTEKIIDDVIKQMIPVRKEELKQHIEDLSKAREQLLSNPELVFINASNILDKEANNGEHNPT